MSLLLTCLLLAPRVRAEERPGAWVRVSGGACLESERLEEQVLEYGGLDEAPSELSVVVRADEPAGFDIVHAGRVVGKRDFDSLPENCEERARVLAVSIAIALENHLTAAASEERDSVDSRSGEVPTDDDAAEPSSSASSVDEPETDEGEPPRFETGTMRPGPLLRLGVGGGVVQGVLPRFSGLGVVSLDMLTGGRQRFSVGLSGWMSARTSSALQLGRVRSQVVGGGMTGCFEPTWGVVRGEACLGARLGLMNAQATGLLASRTATSWWGAGLARLGLRFPTGSPVGLHLAAEGFANLVRPGVAVAVEGPGDVEDNAPILGYSSIAEVFWVFP